ncbi:hypothetical protein [Novosphingobium resinovorum]|uniref:hypothetical protein n=1 Tax=Novosphingobium resinovorum TaxID=158500 RepID=UPI0012DFB165|nr:hypothetical protein [Novosphingobium resinovorum]
MPDNDNTPLSGAEQSLLAFVTSIRPESGPLLKLRASIERWLWQSKLCALACLALGSGYAILTNWNGWPAAFILFCVIAPVFMIDRLEQIMGRWTAHLSFQQGNLKVNWRFTREAVKLRNHI